MPGDNYFIYPALTHPDSRQLMVWKSTSGPDSAYHYFSYIITADVVGDSVAPPDTVARVDAESFSYSGTSWDSTTWVSFRDGTGLEAALRIYRKRGSGPWRQMRTPGLFAYQGLRSVAIDSVTVLVVTGEESYDTRWALLRDTTWIVSPQVLWSLSCQAPNLARGPDGTIRCMCLGFDNGLYERTYRDGVWSEPDTVRAIVPHPDWGYIFYEVSASAEESARPALVWDGYAVQHDTAFYVWVAFPTDSGIGVGERIEDSWEASEPTAVRDENEDVWVAWWRWSQFQGAYWTHSYTTATSSAPVVDEESGRPRLRWTLSESAPGTWWGVMRSVGGAPAERVARVRATPALTVSWADSSAPAAASIRYAIRRECRDVRYQITSASAEWRSRDPRIALTRRSANPASDAIEFELSGAAAGRVEVVLYDVQGRVAMTQRAATSGSGVDALRVPFATSLRSGLYFLRVRGSDGRESRPIKLAVLR